MNKHNSFLFSLILFFASCIQEVQTEFPEMEREVVVNGLLVADEYAKVHLSWSGGLRQDGVLENIEDALVMLSTSDMTTDTLTYFAEGLFIGNQTLEAGKEYLLSVQVTGQPTITASDKIPIAKSFTDLENIRIAGFKSDLDGAFSALRFKIQHDTSEEDYFFINSFAMINDFKSELIYHPPFDPVIQNEGLPIPLFSSKEMGIEPYQINLNFETSSSSRVNGIWITSYSYLLLELQTLSASTFQYYQQAYLHNKGRNKDFEQLLPPVVNVYSNIENGRGILAAFARYRSDTLLPPPLTF